MTQRELAERARAFTLNRPPLFPEEPDPGPCPCCSGSGQGATEHTRCAACRGRGVLPSDAQVDLWADEAADAEADKLERAEWDVLR